MEGEAERRLGRGLVAMEIQLQDLRFRLVIARSFFPVECDVSLPQAFRQMGSSFNGRSAL